MCYFTESVVEDAALAWLEGLGYAVLYGPDISPGVDILTLALSQREREQYSDIVLERRLREMVEPLASVDLRFENAEKFVGIAR
jgi:type I restriction enzyme R subunit